MAWTDLLFGLGFVAVAEGLLLALIPGRVAEALALLARLPLAARRLLGLLAATLGVALITFARV